MKIRFLHFRKKQEVEQLEPSQVIDKDDKTMLAYAENMADGSKGLRNLLLTLWKKQIGTPECCPGRMPSSDGKDMVPYISFDLSRISPEQVVKLFERIKSQFGDEVTIATREIFSWEEPSKDFVTIYYSDYYKNKHRNKRTEQVFGELDLDIQAIKTLPEPIQYTKQQRIQMILGLLAVQPGSITVYKFDDDSLVLESSILENTFSGFSLSLEEAKQLFPSQAKMFEKLKPDETTFFYPRIGANFGSGKSFE